MLLYQLQHNTKATRGGFGYFMKINVTVSIYPDVEIHPNPVRHVICVKRHLI
jgi:hypothetical protein